MSSRSQSVSALTSVGEDLEERQHEVAGGLGELRQPRLSAHEVILRCERPIHAVINILS